MDGLLHWNVIIFINDDDDDVADADSEIHQISFRIVLVFTIFNWM